MTKLQYQSFQLMISEFSLAYRNFKLDDNQKDYWYQYFRSCDEKSFLQAVRTHIAKEKFEPRIATLLKILKDQSKDGYTRQELKEYVRKKRQRLRKELKNE